MTTMDAHTISQPGDNPDNLQKLLIAVRNLRTGQVAYDNLPARPDHDERWKLLKEIDRWEREVDALLQKVLQTGSDEKPP